MEERECNLVGAKARNRRERARASKAKCGKYLCVGCHRSRVPGPSAVCWRCEGPRPTRKGAARVRGAMSPRKTMGEDLRAKFDWLMNGEGLKIKD